MPCRHVISRWLCRRFDRTIPLCLIKFTNRRAWRVCWPWFGNLLSDNECYRCKGAHCKWQCPAKPSVEEKKGERDPRKWGLVPMCTLEPSKVLPRSVFALSGLVSTASEVPAQALVSTSLEEMRTDMSSLIQEVKGSRDDVEGALNALTNMAGSLNALALAVQALQH
jgi:hypothetical protein